MFLFSLDNSVAEAGGSSQALKTALLGFFALGGDLQPGQAQKTNVSVHSNEGSTQH